MAKLTYRDFQQRISIGDVLTDMGYRPNPKDGRTYPSYIREKGDKFIVTRNGLACFRPPEQKCYNVISLIKSFPDCFADYKPGMDKDRLVNLVCNRLLNNPVELQTSYSDNRHTPKPFDIYDYDVVAFDKDNWESQKQFYPYFKGRGIDINTQRAFCGHFFLATRHLPDGRAFTNLSFPLSYPAWPGKEIVGLEERSRPNGDGKCTYKGLARGSDATEGLWIARLNNGFSDRGFTKSLGHVEDIYWFESAYDAMAYYQINRDKRDLKNAVFLSTCGTPSMAQMRGMLRESPQAFHHLCFDNDRAGHLFAINFAMASDNRFFRSTFDEDSGLTIQDVKTLRKETIDIGNFDFDVMTNRLNIDTSKIVRHLPDEPYKDWNEQLLGEQRQTIEEDRNRGFHR